MRRLNSQFMTKYISEAGSRPTNRDYFGFVELDDFVCWVMAEGYDKDTTVNSAKLAVDTVIGEFTRRPSLSKRTIKRCIKEAHRQLKLQSGTFRLKASILMVVSNYTKIRYALCGNCRLHVFRGSMILEKSYDTSLYQEMLAEQNIVDDGVSGMEESRNLLEYLGKRGRLHISVSKKKKLQNEDILLLTTWGLWEKITTVEMLDALEGTDNAMAYIDDLQDLYLSKQTHTVNNYTIATVFVNKIFQEKDNKRKYIKMAIAITIPLLLVGALVGFANWKANRTRKTVIDTILESEEKGDDYVLDSDFERALQQYDTAIEDGKALKGKKGKKGEENTEIKERLDTKQKATQYLLDGDADFTEGKYGDAMEQYKKAMAEAKKEMDFYDKLDIEELKEKLAFCDTADYIEALLSLAETQIALEDYVSAEENYSEAKQLAVESGDKKQVEEINLKIKEMQSAREEAAMQEETKAEEAAAEEKEQKTADGATIELEADGLLAEGDIETAKEYYKIALQMYKEAGALAEASAVQKKMIEADSSLKELDNTVRIAEADAYVLAGDNQMLENAFGEAKESYKTAKDIYMQTKQSDKVAEMTEKIATAAAREKENDIAAQQMEIGIIEARGDESLKLRDYDKAKEFYLQAQVLYQGINDMEKVLQIQEKIKTLAELEEQTKAAVIAEDVTEEKKEAEQKAGEEEP